MWRTTGLTHWLESYGGASRFMAPAGTTLAVYR